MTRKGPKPIPTEDRFWGHVDKSDPEGCWIWTGAMVWSPTRRKYGYTTTYGYTFIGSRADGSLRMIHAHRLSWMIANGPIPEGMQVLHKCDNPPCVRPDHLFLGTKSDNSKDMVSKGRHGRRTHPEAYADTWRNLGAYVQKKP